MGGPRKTRRMRAAFLSKGFIADETHHEMFWLVIGGGKRRSEPGSVTVRRNTGINC